LTCPLPKREERVVEESFGFVVALSRQFQLTDDRTEAKGILLLDRAIFVAPARQQILASRPFGMDFTIVATRAPRDDEAEDPSSYTNP
jgi:hypothetical protein